MLGLIEGDATTQMGGGRVGHALPLFAILVYIKIDIDCLNWRHTYFLFNIVWHFFHSYRF